MAFGSIDSDHPGPGSAVTLPPSLSSPPSSSSSPSAASTPGPSNLQLQIPSPDFQLTHDNLAESLQYLNPASSSSSGLSSSLPTPTSSELEKPASPANVSTTTTTRHVPRCNTSPTLSAKRALSPRSPPHLSFPRTDKPHQKVRFPAGNNPLSKKIHLPDDDNDHGHELKLEPGTATTFTPTPIKRQATRRGSIAPKIKLPISDDESDCDFIEGNLKTSHKFHADPTISTETATIINTLKNRGGFSVDTDDEEEEEEEITEEEMEEEAGSGRARRKPNFNIPLRRLSKGKTRWSNNAHTNPFQANSPDGFNHSSYFDTSPSQSTDTFLAGDQASSSSFRPTAAFAAAAVANQQGQMIGRMLKYGNMGGGGLVPGPGTLDHPHNRRSNPSDVDIEKNQISQDLIEYKRKLLLSQARNAPSWSEPGLSPYLRNPSDLPVGLKTPQIIAFGTDGDSRTIYNPELSPDLPEMMTSNESNKASTEKSESEIPDIAQPTDLPEIATKFQSEAQKLVRSHTKRLFRTSHANRKKFRKGATIRAPGSSYGESKIDYFNSDNPDSSMYSGDEMFDSSFDGDFESQSNSGGDGVGGRGVAANGILGNLLKLYDNDSDNDELSRSGNSSSSLVSFGHDELTSPISSPMMSTSPTPSLLSPINSGAFNTKPRLGHKARSLSNKLTSKIVDQPEWYNHKRQQSAISLASMPSSPSPLSSWVETDDDPAANKTTPRGTPTRPKFYQRHSGGGNISGIKKLAKKNRKHLNREERIRITVHIAEVLQRQKFILKMCKCIMLFGAPTHRLEEYMRKIAYILEIDCYFIYLPGCMIVSFGDSTTHTSEMRLVQCQQGVNLSKLNDLHIIYKEVIHDMISVEEAFPRIDQLLTCKNLYSPWWCVLLFGISSGVVTTGLFNGNWLDMAVSLVFGCLVGMLQIIVAPKSDLYSNIFEVSCAVLVSFFSRALGSIQNGKYFCYTAIVQGSITLILPGYTILCGALEIQSKNIVSGAVRMIYAIVYSLFLGFGISAGAIIYGLIDSNAVSVADGNSVCNYSPLSPWFGFLFVPVFALGLALVNQARWIQLPVMVLIASAGYAVTYFVDLRFPDSVELTSAIGAFTIGILGNIHSRLTHGLGFAAMLPAIFLLIPFCLAAQGSIIEGIQPDDVSTDTSKGLYTTMSLGSGMLKISIGLTVGLFAAALVVYPTGKKRSGLFTF